VAAFTDESEVYEFLGGVFRRGMQDPALVEKLKPSGVVLRITYTDPAAVITVDMPGSEMFEGADMGPEPNVELFMSADTGNKFWLGKVVLPVALAKGQVRAKGPVHVRPVPGEPRSSRPQGFARRLKTPIGCRCCPPNGGIRYSPDGCRLVGRTDVDRAAGHLPPVPRRGL